RVIPMCLQISAASGRLAEPENILKRLSSLYARAFFFSPGAFVSTCAWDRGPLPFCSAPVPELTGSATAVSITVSFFTRFSQAGWLWLSCINVVWLCCCQGLGSPVGVRAGACFASLAGRLGFEPRQSAPKALDLPLVDRPVTKLQTAVNSGFASGHGF